MYVGALALKTTISATRLGKLIRQTRTAKKLTQRDLATAIGHTAARISQIECGQVASEDIALKIARRLRLDAQTVLSLLQKDKLDERMAKLAVRQPDLVPRDFPDLVSGGIPQTEPGQEETYDSLNWVAVIGEIPSQEPLHFDIVSGKDAAERVPIIGMQASHLYALKVKGSSMTQWGIQNGDLIAVDLEAQWSNGDEVVADIDTELSLRKIRRVQGGVILEDANGNSMIFADNSKEVNLRGVVISLIKNRKGS